MFLKMNGNAKWRSGGLKDIAFVGLKGLAYYRHSNAINVLLSLVNAIIVFIGLTNNFHYRKYFAYRE